MFATVAPIPSEKAPWNFRVASWYLNRRASRERTVREPHLSHAMGHSFLYQPMMPECLASFVD